MTKFSPSDSALQGFRLTRERPWTVFVWSLVYFVSILFMGAVMLVGLGPKLIKFIKHGGLGSGDVGAYGLILRQSLPAFVLSLLLALFLMSVLTGGIYRIVLRPQEKGFAHLRIGPDEWRLTLVNLILLSIGIVSFVVVKEFADIIGGLAGVAGGLLLTGFVIWIGVRLLLATPMTFAQGRLAILDSWRLTQGHFWKLLAMVVLAIIFWVMVWLVCAILGAVCIALAGGQEAMDHPLSMGPVALFAFAGTLFVQLLLPTLQIVMIYSPVAEAYRELRDEVADAATPVQPGQVTA
jgi:hypothetical protein